VTINNKFLKAPFPWAGGKSRVAHVVWQKFGDVKHYVEPFAGSLAVLLGRPNPEVAIQERAETVNDKDCYLVNFWRSVKADPEAVVKWADYPVTEADLVARNKWLIEHKQEFVEKCFTDPEYCDFKIAGWWVYGVSLWFGEGYTTKNYRKRPDINSHGRGVFSKTYHTNAEEWINTLSARLRRVRVTCGDWKRLLDAPIDTSFSNVGIFLDPPYSSNANRAKGLYPEEDLNVANEVREWAIANAHNPKYRIAMCGYEGEHEFPSDWECHSWSSTGYVNAGKNGLVNRHKERIWFSPYCLKD